ncbi:MAG: GFA family protein, partial [Pseudomonadota bacterium]
CLLAEAPEDVDDLTKIKGVGPGLQTQLHNLGVYKSSPEVERTFCKVCGTPISYMISSRPGELQLYTMTLDFPEKMTPMEHVHCEEQLPWFRVDDELRRHKGSALDDE